MEEQNDYRKTIIKQVREVFKLPRGCTIDVNEAACNEDNNDKATEIVIWIGKNKTIRYIINKHVQSITDKDIDELYSEVKISAFDKYPFLSKFTKLFGWWVIFAGSFSLFSICPVCGQVGCPVGVGITGILAGVLAVLKLYLKDFWISLISFTTRIFSKQRVE